MTKIDEHALLEFRENTTQRLISEIVLDFIPYMSHHAADLNFAGNAIDIGVRPDKVRGRKVDFEVSRSIEVFRIGLMLVAHIWSYLGSAITHKSTTKSSGDLVLIICSYVAIRTAARSRTCSKTESTFGIVFRSGDPVLPQLLFEALGSLSAECHLCAYGVALDDLVATDLSDAGAQLQVSVVLALIASDRLKDVGSEIVMACR